ncbi:MAG: gamma-glutamyltransferase [Actinobacteria bacterium]|nr:gamma-glutamyltransferase [Actinomycetota bacterium]
MPERLPRPRIEGQHLAVSCGHPLAVQAGLRVGAAGGNAIDAAAAAAAALTVILPDACGLGGDLLCIVRRADGSVTAINGVGRSPAASTHPLPDDGARVAAVPGFVAGVCDLIAAGGRLSRAEVLAPALELAEQGVAVTRDTAEALVDNAARLTRGGADVSPWVAARPSGVGAIVRLPETAVTLRGIIERGPEAFYAGPMAAAIVAAVAREDGVMSLDDLAGHESVIREPVPVDYRGVTVLAQPPSSQAMLLTMALRRLAAEAPSDGSAAAQHRAVEAIAGAFAYRDRITQNGADRELMELADAIPIGERASRADHAKGYNHTTSVTTADREGNVVSMLISVFDSFGCATWVPGGGFFLNDRLLSFSRDPESPNAAAGGKRPVHTLSPAMVVDGRRIVGISTPSADGQVQALLQVLLAHLDEGAEIGDACDRPRWRVVGDLLRVEEDVEPDLAAGLAALGHEVMPAPVGDSLFGSVCASEADLDSGLVSCWADPRRESWAGAW